MHFITNVSMLDQRNYTNKNVNNRGSVEVGRGVLPAQIFCKPKSALKKIKRILTGGISKLNLLHRMTSHNVCETLTQHLHGRYSVKVKITSNIAIQLDMDEEEETGVNKSVITQ